MCDQTEVTYSDGDVVWVKIGSVWWPGVVTDVEKDGSGSEILAGLRSKPIAVVKFFNEDSYEFVKNLNNIYHYNCRQKDEFIKKGLEKHRKGVAHMKKFPDDVKRAQKLLNEDENIVNSPKFAPVEKVNYNDVFGDSPKKKMKKEELSLRTKILPLKKRISAPVTSTRSKGQNCCRFCDFSIDSLDVLMVHIKYNHTSERVDFSVKGSEKKPVSTPKRRNTSVPKPKKKLMLSETHPKKSHAHDEKKEAAKETPATAAPAADVKKTSVKQDKSADKKKRYTDVLLADWSEDDQNRSDDEDESIDNPKTDLNENTKNSELTVEVKEKKAAPVAEKPAAAAKKETASCFDFDEEDDGFIGMSNANTYGRKIPRVIPDKIELGMDPEIEELFKRKPESEQEEEAPPPVKRKRGRPPRSSKLPQAQPPKSSPKSSEESLASSRERRPGALKSYIGEIIEKIPNADEQIENDNNEPPKPPSRRKQDLKRQSLKEFDEIEALIPEKRSHDVDYKPPVRMLHKRKELEIEAQKKRLHEFDNLESKTQALLAELSPKVAETASNDDECMDMTVEYLEDEPEPVTPSPVKSQPVTSPIKKWKEDIRLAMDGDSPVKKSIIPQWKQGIQEAMKANKDTHHIKKIVFNTKTMEPGTSSMVKVSKVTNKGNNTLLILPESRKIINKQPHVVVLSKQAAAHKPIVVTGRSPTGKVTTQPFLKVISDGHGGTKKVVSQKTVQIGTKASPSNTIVLSGGKRETGIQVVRKFNGTGKTFILGSGGGGQTIYRRLRNVTSVPGTSAVKSNQCVVKTVKAPVSQYKTVRFISSSSDKTLAGSPQKRQFILRPSEQQPVQIVQREPEPEPMPMPMVEEPQVVVQMQQPQALTPGAQQVIAMQHGEGKTTYMIVTLDSTGNVQQLDPSLLTYDVQQPEVASSIYEPANVDLTPTYASAGQDILAEALANTNVLESEMPLTSLIMPTIEGQTILSDNSGLITTPIVQETSVTLQKPIMSPIEVPSSVVADTSGLQPPPLPPTPTEEDVLLEDPNESLLIADQEQQPHPQEEEEERQQQQQQLEGQVIEAQDVEQSFFIEDSQEGESDAFQSMPLLTEDATANEETIVEQQYEEACQVGSSSEYLSPSTDAAIEQQVTQEELSKYQQDAPEMYASDGTQLIFVQDQVADVGIETAEADSTNQTPQL